MSKQTEIKMSSYKYMGWEIYKTACGEWCLIPPGKTFPSSWSRTLSAAKKRVSLGYVE